MRSYSTANDLVKLSEDDVPLVPLDELRRRGLAVPIGYGDHVPLNLQKFPTRAETWATRQAAESRWQEASRDIQGVGQTPRGDHKYRSRRI